MMIIRLKNIAQHSAWLVFFAFATTHTALGESGPQGPAQQALNTTFNSSEKPDPVQGTILTIFSYHPEMDWVNSLLAGFSDGLDSLPNVEHYTEFLDTKRHPSIAHSGAFLKGLKDKYANQQPDVLMISDDPAFELIQNHMSELFPGVPVIFFGLNNIRENLPPSFTGIYEVHEAKPTLDIAMELTKASGVAVISDSTESGISHEHTLDAAIEAYPDLEWVILRDVVSNELSALQELPDDWPILPLLGLRQGSPEGPSVSHVKTAEILRAELPNPMFWSTEFMMGSGIVGGYMLHAEAHAQQALDLAVQVLNGTNPNDIPPITRTPHEWRFDWRELDRYGWVDQIPQDAEVLFKPPSFIQRHREILAPVAFAIFSLLSIIGALVWHLRAEKRHAARLESETRRSTAALLAADAGIFEIKADGTSVCCNRWLEMIGTEDTIASCSSSEWLNQLTDKSSKELEERFQQLREGSDRERLEIEMQSPRRLIKLMLMREGDSPETASIVGIGTDETNHRRVERQAESRARLHSLGQLAGGVAHDFNNLLMAIIGNAQMIPLENSNEKKDSLAKSIVDVGDRAEALTQRLLTFGHVEEVHEPAKTDLNHSVSELHDLLNGLAKHCTVSLELNDGPLICKVSPSSIDQILTNLVVNARDAMDGQGLIEVQTFKRLDDMGAPVAVLCVQDTGIGMDLDTTERLFEPFFSTKGAGQGTGLGLSIVYGLVSSSGGTISVESQKGIGSNFKIAWPLFNTTQDESERLKSFNGVETGAEREKVI